MIISTLFKCQSSGLVSKIKHLPLLSSTNNDVAHTTPAEPFLSENQIIAVWLDKQKTTFIALTIM